MNYLALRAQVNAQIRIDLRKPAVKRFYLWLSSNDYQIYYHVGLGKAASTYLQNRVFPVLEGIRYVHRDRYRHTGNY